MTSQSALQAQIADSVNGRTLKTSRRGFRPAKRSDFRRGTILAFDQTLTKTGWSLVTVGDRITIPDSGLIKIDIDRDVTSHERTMDKADVLYSEILDVLERKAQHAQKIVYERSAVVGHRTESSLIAAVVLRLACKRLMRVPVGIHRQRLLSDYLGPGQHEKKDVTEAVNALVADEDRHGKHWNQDVHDSVLLALGFLDKRRSQ